MMPLRPFTLGLDSGSPLTFLNKEKQCLGTKVCCSINLILNLITYLLFGLLVESQEGHDLPETLLMLPFSFYYVDCGSKYGYCCRSSVGIGISGLLYAREILFMSL